MPVWADLPTAVAALRAFLDDGPTDRPIKAKQVRGTVDGVNQTFTTWEDRLVVNTLVASIDDVDQPGGSLTVLELIMGRFSLTPAPPTGSVVRAHYYFQYFTDSDLEEAMREACGEVLQIENPDGIPIGLKQSTLNFGAFFAFTKQSIRWATRMSGRFLLQEEPIDAETMNRSNLFKDLADGFFDKARVMRDDFYMRHSRRQAPAFAVFKPRIGQIGPRR